MGLSSFLQNDFQHEAYRSIDSKYHAAPKTCKSKKKMLYIKPLKELEGLIASYPETWERERERAQLTWLASMYNSRL